MSHFILQSIKIAKITDGTTTLTLFGTSGKDNNVHYYGTHKSSVEFFRCFKTDPEIQCLRKEIVSSVLSGSTHLKDMYHKKPLREQASVAIARLDVRLKNAKTYQIERIGKDGTIEWGTAQSQIAADQKITCRFSKNLVYVPMDLERMDAMDQAAADFVKSPQSDPQSIGRIIEHLPYALAYLDPKAHLTERQLVHLLSHASNWDSKLNVRAYHGYISDPQDAIALARGQFFSYGNVPELIQVLSPKLQSDNDLALQLLEAKPWVYPHMPLQTRLDDPVGRKACALETANYAHAPESVRLDKDITLTCLKARASDLTKYVPSTLLEDPEVALTAVKRSGQALQHLPPRFQDEEALVKVAVKNDCSAFAFASERLRGDIQVCQLAMREHYQKEVLQHASAQIQQQVHALVESKAQPSIIKAVEHLAAKQLAVQEAKTISAAARTPGVAVPVPKRPSLDRAL
jgi:hypothetical protein